MTAFDSTTTLPLTLQSPAIHAEAVTPSDTVNLGAQSRSLFVGTGGNIAVVMADGSTATFTNVPGGFVLPICVTRVNSTNTTASNIVSIS